MTFSSLICFGFGYVAQALSKSDPVSKWEIFGTKRSPETNSNQQPENVTLLTWPSPSFSLPDVKAVLVSVPPDDEGCPVFRQFKDYFDPETYFAYLSSTGVYGDLQGGWAFEETPVNPLSTEAKRRVIAETQWQGLGAHIFRLPGIYGPGRSAFDRLKQGRARRIVKEGQVFSRAHVDDIADVLARSIARPNPGQIYNIADDHPCPAQDVIAYAAQLLGAEPPPEVRFEDANLPEKAQRFYAECKRLSNARTKAELGWLPKYPDYRSGLNAIFDASN